MQNFDVKEAIQERKKTRLENKKELEESITKRKEKRKHRYARKS